MTAPIPPKKLASTSNTKDTTNSPNQVNTQGPISKTPSQTDKVEQITNKEVSEVSQPVLSDTYKPKYSKTEFHKLLAREKSKFGCDLSSALANFDRVADKVKETLEQQGLITEGIPSLEQSKQIISKIRETLKDIGFSISRPHEEKLLASEIIDPEIQSFACFYGSVLYYSINEALDLKIPMKFMESPRHAFLKIEDQEEGYFNFETTSLSKDSFRTNDYYLDIFYIDFESIGSIKAEDIQKSSPESIYSQHLGQMAGHALDLQNIQLAKRLCEDGLKHNSKDITCINSLVQSYMAVGQLKKALILLTNTIEQNTPEKGSLLCNRAYLYNALKEPNKALTDLEEAVKLIPENPDAWYSKALVSFSLDKKEEAIKDTLNAIQHASKYPSMTPMNRMIFKLGYYYGSLYDDNQNKETLTRAIRAYKTALQISQKDLEYSAYAHYNLALTYKGNGDKESALEHINECLKIYPQDTDYIKEQKEIKALKTKSD